MAHSDLAPALTRYREWWSVMGSDNEWGAVEYMSISPWMMTSDQWWQCKTVANYRFFICPPSLVITGYHGWHYPSLVVTGYHSLQLILTLHHSSSFTTTGAHQWPPIVTFDHQLPLVIIGVWGKSLWKKSNLSSLPIHNEQEPTQMWRKPNAKVQVVQPTVEALTGDKTEAQYKTLGQCITHQHQGWWWGKQTGMKVSGWCSSQEPVMQHSEWVTKGYIKGRQD